LLNSLDSHHLIKYYLEKAIDQRSITALESAIAHANKEQFTGEELTNAERLLVDWKRDGVGKEKKKEKKEKKIRTDLEKHRRASSKKSAGTFGFFRNKKSTEFTLFGGQLSDAIARSSYPVPYFCYQCIEWIRQYGMKEVGIFRVGGNKEMIENIRARFETINEDTVTNINELILEPTLEPHDVANVIKLYLRLLPEPLIPYQQYSRWIAVGNLKQSDSNAIAAALPTLRSLLSVLPNDSYGLLEYLVRFLVVVSSHNNENKMTAENLSIVFTPNILHAKEENEKTMMETVTAISLLTTLIVHCDSIFGSESHSFIVQQMRRGKTASSYSNPNSTHNTWAGPVSSSPQEIPRHLQAPTSNDSQSSSSAER
jgi:hypothetical protein